MEFRTVASERERFLDLLLLADEEETMIARYLDRGEMIALYDGGLRGVCVVTNEGEGLYELQNIVIVPEHRGRGYGRALILHVLDRYRGQGVLQVGTGGRTAAFYASCGFEISHTLKNYFTEHYSRPIVEDGVWLLDKIYLKRVL